MDARCPPLPSLDIQAAESQPAASIDVIRHGLSRLESFRVPKTVIFVDELPKTDTAKIKKTDLR